MVIIESSDDLKLFNTENKKQDSFVVPILSDVNKHPVDNELSLIYVQMVDGKEFIIPYNHSESLNNQKVSLVSNTTKYTHDKKLLSQVESVGKCIDVNLLEYCRKLCRLLESEVELIDHSDNMTYNNEVLVNLSYIEENGLQTTEGMVYSEYNIYTSTGRPSNRFGGMNFAALNKKDGSREKFISRYKNGVLVEMDYDGYHLRLIADRIGYEFSQGSVHKHMAGLYGVDYDEAKSLSFQYLYGYIPDEIRSNNEYFNKVHTYIQGLWSQYKSKEFIVSDIYSKKIYKKNLVDMNANKLFNYTIQLMETESNMKVLSELIPKIDNDDYKSKLVLYNYDAFVFDFNMEDGLDYLMKVKGILEQKGKFPVKVSWGLNYHEMTDITEKFV